MSENKDFSIGSRWKVHRRFGGPKVGTVMKVEPDPDSQSDAVCVRWDRSTESEWFTSDYANGNFIPVAKGGV